MRSLEFQMLTLLSSVALLSGCDKLTATTFAVSIVTETPRLDEAAGWDAALDGIVTNDMVPAATAALVGVGRRDSVTSTEPPRPVADATVKLSWQRAGGSVSVTLCPAGGAQANGSYQATSAAGVTCGTAALTYDIGAVYKTTIDDASDSYSLQVAAPEPVSPAGVRFEPAMGAATSLDMPLHAKDTGLAVDWGAATTGRNTFVTLARVRFTGTDITDPVELFDAANWDAEPALLFDNTPRTPAAMLDVLTGTPPTTVTIPATAFAAAGVYVLVLTPTELDDDTTNLMLGSAALAGKGTGFVFIVN